MKCALTVQIDRETLEIESETDMTTTTSIRIVLRKEGEAIHAHHPLLVDQDNHPLLIDQDNHPLLVDQDNHPLLVDQDNHPLLVDQDNPYLLKKTPSEMATLCLSGKNSTPAPEPFATKVLSMNAPKESLSAFSMSAIPRWTRFSRRL